MEELKRIVANVLNIETEKIDDSLSRDNIPEWDSFNHLMLISEIEKKANIRFTIPEVEKIKNLRGLKDIVNRKINGGSK